MGSEVDLGKGLSIDSRLIVQLLRTFLWRLLEYSELNGVR